MYIWCKLRSVFAPIIVLLAAIVASGSFLLNISAHAAFPLRIVRKSTHTHHMTNDPASEVDPFTGTSTQPGAPFGGGFTFPGAVAPFGMLQWSPDTKAGGPGGYWYGSNTIRGFSLTHLNGAGCVTAGDIPFMPYVGKVTASPASNPTNYLSTYDHNNESATAGYYQVRLNNGVNSELTALQHSGMGRFTYPGGKQATMLINVAGSALGSDDAQVTIGKDTVAGWTVTGHFCGSKVRYRVYFWAQFSQPFANSGTWHDKTLSPHSTTARSRSTTAPAVKQAVSAETQVRHDKLGTLAVQSVQHPDTTAAGPGAGAYVSFNTVSSNVITVRVGLSYVSINNAQDNVNHENPDWNFDAIHQQVHQRWNSWLGRIAIQGGNEAQRTTFYSALYHTLLQPNVFSDVNGQYIGFDSKIHTTDPDHPQYANYSGWDVYRSEFQLLALLAPNETSDIVQSMLNDYDQSGMLPKWSLNNSETYVMNGDPADAMIADAYAFGARDFDASAALSAMVKQATQHNNIRPFQYPQTDRRKSKNFVPLHDLPDMSHITRNSSKSSSDLPLGYLPIDGTYGCCDHYGPAATTLEYDTADFSIASLAQALGDNTTYQTFLARANNWKKLYNPATGYLEPRYLNGTFPAKYNPASSTNWVEGNGAQYTWMVPFNLRGLFNTLGGNNKVNQRLDTFFSQLNAGPSKPYAFLGNEPTLGTPWLYDYAGTPYKTQALVRRIVNTLYYPGPMGLAGNDDLGELSSWYVFAALGFYPETPGSANLVLGSPLFTSTIISRERGQIIRITAPQAASDTPYIQSLIVNGQISTQPWLPATLINNSSLLSLDFTLSKIPNPTWGSDPNNAPPSYP
jgi:predicted alpha-1,2-mannosidase